MKRVIVAGLISFLGISSVSASAFYGNCNLTASYDVKNRPSTSGDGWNTVKEGTEVGFYKAYRNWGYISLSDGFLGWIPMNFLKCEDIVWKRIAQEKK